jgi:hypothetical protein
MRFENFVEIATFSYILIGLIWIKVVWRGVGKGLKN